MKEVFNNKKSAYIENMTTERSIDGISYTLKRSWLEKINVSNLKVFVSGKNLVTLTNWIGDDPETGSTVLSSALPVAKSVTGGITLSF